MLQWWVMGADTRVVWMQLFLQGRGAGWMDGPPGLSLVMGMGQAAPAQVIPTTSQCETTKPL